MGLVDRLLGRSSGVVANTLTPTIQVVTPVPYVSSSSILGLSAVWRCVTLIADVIADMPWQEWTGLETDSASLLPSSRLVRKPFALRSRRWWTWRIAATEALYSTAYCLHVGGYDSAGAPWSLLPVPPAVIAPRTPIDPWGLSFPAEYIVGGLVVPDWQVSIIERAPFPGISTQLQGLLDVARMQFGAMLAADTYTARYWNNGGSPRYQVAVDEYIDDPEAERISQRVADRMAMGRPLVFGQGGKLEELGADPLSASATEARREINAEVGRYFGVPTRILNAPAGDSETYSNVENDAIDLLRYTLRGYMGPIEDAISDQLPGDAISGRRMLMQPERFLQGDLASRSTAYSTLVGGAAILSVDEARRRGFQLPPISSAEQAATTAANPNVAAATVNVQTTGAPAPAPAGG